MTPEARQETGPGIELQWATNVLGYHWLTKYLLEEEMELVLDDALTTTSTAAKA